MKKVAILDLYNGAANLGMANIQKIISENGFSFEVFDVRAKGEIPSTEFDIYISTGGPGSPFDGEGKEWEQKYFSFVEKLWHHNQYYPKKKHVFFICHSFQMMVRHFNLGQVCKRKSMSFGIFPVHLTDEAKEDGLFQELPHPFYAADFRYYQVVQPNEEKLKALGGHIIALEKVRPHVEMDRAVMAMQISPEFIGTQFHPEADPEGMKTYYAHPEKRLEVEKTYGEYKYETIMECLEDKDSDSILNTYQHILPNFLRQASEKLYMMA